MLSEMSQAQKDKCCMIHLREAPRGGRLIETERRVVVARGWRGEQRVSVQRVWSQFGAMEKVLWVDHGDVCTTLGMCLMPLICTFAGG